MIYPSSSGGLWSFHKHNVFLIIAIVRIQHLTHNTFHKFTHTDNEQSKGYAYWVCRPGTAVGKYRKGFFRSEHCCNRLKYKQRLLLERELLRQ